LIVASFKEVNETISSSDGKISFFNLEGLQLRQKKNRHGALWICLTEKVLRWKGGEFCESSLFARIVVAKSPNLPL